MPRPLRVAVYACSFSLVAMGGVATATSDAGTHPERVAVPSATAAPGTLLWSKFLRIGDKYPSSIAFGPFSGRVYVTGGIGAKGFGDGLTTVAYDPNTGTRLWTKRTQLGDVGEIAVSSDGRRVFVTGSTPTPQSVTVAYWASTGAQLWVRRVPGFTAAALAVDPLGTRVFVTGQIGSDYETIAYSAKTGVRQWVRRYNGPSNRNDSANAIAVQPSGYRVLVTGRSVGANGKGDFTTVAYRSTTGARLWVKRYNGPASGDDVARAVTVFGGRVFVTGSSPGVGSGTNVATIAYSVATGARLWVRRYGTGGGAAKLTPAGTRLLVTAVVDGSYPATVAYKAADGTQLTAARAAAALPAWHDPQLHLVAVSPATNRMIVGREGLSAIAYDLKTGEQVWSGHNPNALGYDRAGGVAVSPNGTRVIVTGIRCIVDPDASDGYLTIGYRN